MITRKQENRWYFFTILISISSLEARNFNLVFDAIKCIPNSEYVENYSCTVDKTTEPNRLNVDIQMKKEVQESVFDFAVYGKNPKREKLSTLFKADGIRFCELTNKDTLIPIFNMLKDMVSKAGNLPKGCPIPANYHYSFKNITINPKYLPSYAPKVSLSIILVVYNRKTTIFNITVLERIIPTKSKNKDRRHF